MLTLSLATSKVLAQQPGLETSRPQTDSPPLRYDPHLAPLLIEDAQPTQSEAIQSKHLKVSGPLVHQFNAKKILDAPRRLLHLVNPFAHQEPRQELENVGDLSPRAWATVVGWHPGRSAFEDPVTHEPTMGFFSCSQR